jgi:hypothetical protein
MDILSLKSSAKLFMLVQVGALALTSYLSGIYEALNEGCQNETLTKCKFAPVYHRTYYEMLPFYIGFHRRDFKFLAYFEFVDAASIKQAHFCFTLNLYYSLMQAFALPVDRFAHMMGYLICILDPFLMICYAAILNFGALWAKIDLLERWKRFASWLIPKEHKERLAKMMEGPPYSETVEDTLRSKIPEAGPDAGPEQ